MSTPPTSTDLQRQYKDKLVKYDAAIRSALATNNVSMIPKLQAMNAELNSLLERILKESPVEERRHELVTTLNRIQREYDGLKKNTDTLELLRRIREGETGATRKEFALYLGLFFVTCLGLIAFLLFGGQMTLATTANTPTPIRTAPLM